MRRKKRQELYPTLKLTDIYNVLERLRTREELADKDRQLHEQGLVTVLAELHDELDAARAAEEARGVVGWLRPEFPRSERRHPQTDVAAG